MLSAPTRPNPASTHVKMQPQTPSNSAANTAQDASQQEKLIAPIELPNARIQLSPLENAALNCPQIQPPALLGTPFSKQKR